MVKVEKFNSIKSGNLKKFMDKWGWINSLIEE